MANAADTILHFRFSPPAEGDGAIQQEDGASIPILAPDWDRALELLRRINLLCDANGRRLSSLVTIHGFEPWWYSQDRLFRFYLVPLTQLFPFLEYIQGGEPVILDDMPDTFRLVLKEISGTGGIPEIRVTEQPSDRGTGQMGTGGLLLLALSFASLAAFRLSHRDTVFYIIDHVSPGMSYDFRFAPLYQKFSAHGIPYAEYVHTILPRSGVKNFFRRRRPVFFLESADDIARLSKLLPAQPPLNLPTKPNSSLEDSITGAFAQTVLRWCIHSVGRQRVLAWALRTQKARRAVIFDDSRHNHELTAACRTIGIPVLGFQHGVFNQYHTGLMGYGFGGAHSHAFDRYGVWSELFRNRLLRDSALFQERQVFVSGPIRPPATDSIIRMPMDRRKPIRVLVVSEPLARKQEVAPYLRFLRVHKDFALWFKLRPGESPEGLKEYGIDPEDANLIQTGSVYEAFRHVDVAVGTYSTVLYEAVLAKIPIVWIRTSRAYGRELAEESFSEIADSPEAFPDVIRRAVSLSEAERTNRKERMWGTEFSDGAQRIVNELERIRKTE